MKQYFLYLLLGSLALCNAAKTIADWQMHTLYANLLLFNIFFFNWRNEDNQTSFTSYLQFRNHQWEIKQSGTKAIPVSVAGCLDTDFECPKPKGQFPDDIQCDKYYFCEDGIAQEKLCPDGLVFDPTNKLINKCDQPFNVDCGDRTELQEPKSNKFCPRKNGFFAHPDASVCDVFFNCIDGDALEMKCTVGLHFDEFGGTCVWPDTAKREGCETAQKKSPSGFVCPKDRPKNDESGQVVTHPKFAHPTDCQKFHVCLNGEDPRDLACQLGEVYNEETGMCDAPENVPGCEDWYKDVDDKKSK